MRGRTILVFSLLLVTMAGISILKVSLNESPVSYIKHAKEMLAEADLHEALRYAEAPYLESIIYYDSAMVVWNRENKKFILFRNYQQVIDQANKSILSSQKAIENSKTRRVEMEGFLEIRIDELGKRIKDFEEKLGNFPIDILHRQEIAKSKLFYSEGVLAYKNKNFVSCRLKLDSVEVSIDKVFMVYEEIYHSYLNEYPEWNEMIEKTISFSKKYKSYVIIVDKLARELHLYKNGEILRRFNIELGANWVGPKRQQGDMATPEGMYKIVDIKQKGQTKYYKAFLIDYPNEADKIRFALNKKEGLINQEAKIGNMIEIHGGGGKGIDWTNGCVALKDSDMDVLVKMCPKGTKLTIVGSAKSLSELSK
jgi:Tfp pilus assembly protein PilE